MCVPEQLVTQTNLMSLGTIDVRFNVHGGANVKMMAEWPRWLCIIFSILVLLFQIPLQ